MIFSDKKLPFAELDTKMEMIPYNNNNLEGAYPIHCSVKLKNKELWDQFHSIETEMIITKTGRRMFPSLQVQMEKLDPQAMYCVFLEMSLASRCRYKYSSSGGWAPAGSEEAQNGHKLYLHPDSPARGEYWMSQPVSFGRLKLTNTPAPPAGQIVLSSMHKYQPRLVIARTADPRTLHWSPSSYVDFCETQFIAVTAYQCERITQLKIDNNPFAKGFRQTGQAKSKRKRLNAETEEIINVTDSDETDSSREPPNLNSSNDKMNLEAAELDEVQELSPKRLRIDATDEPVNKEEGRDHSLYRPFSDVYSYTPRNNYPYYPYPYPLHSFYYAYDSYYSRPLSPPRFPYNFNPNVARPRRRFTDFSIRAILGI